MFTSTTTIPSRPVGVTRGALAVAIGALTLAIAVFSAPAAGAAGPPTVVTFDPSSARQGEDLEVEIEGFTPNTGVEVHFGGSTIGTGTTNGDGAATIAATVPSTMPPGTHPLDVYDDAGLDASDAFTVDPPPACHPHTSRLDSVTQSGRPGDPIVVVGRACASEELTVYFDHIHIETARSDHDGDFRIETNFPQGAEEGSHFLDVAGARGTGLTEMVTVAPPPSSTGANGSGDAGGSTGAGAASTPDDPAAIPTPSTTEPETGPASEDGAENDRGDDAEELAAGEQAGGGSSGSDGASTLSLGLAAILVVASLVVLVVLQRRTRRT
ncbi:MAG: hypothetical protein U5K30_14755 [Acidimicrobiales bacterium]|nr:hypothetical protein [Acidimicrobiales bacterium]